VEAEEVVGASEIVAIATLAIKDYEFSQIIAEWKKVLEPKVGISNQIT
jgi:hypothetical protein